MEIAASRTLLHNEKHKTKTLRILAAVVLVVLVTALFYRTEITRLYTVTHLFDEDRIVDNFQHMDELFDTSPIEGGGEVFEFERGSYTPPESSSSKVKRTIPRHISPRR